MSATAAPTADSASNSAADAGTELASLIAALPELYQPLYGHDDHPAPAKRACADRLQHIQAVHDSLANLLERPLRILDLGCAQGYFSLHLAARGASVHGIDADPASIAICQHLAAAQPSLDVHFRLATVEDSLHQLDPADYDLILGLSVLHHLAYKHGADQVRAQLANAAASQNDTGTVLLLELALRDEPLPWAAALPPDPLALLPELAFVHQLASHATHLSDIARPLIVASNSYWVLPPDAGRIDRHSGDPHALAQGHYRGSRHYYDSGTRLIKLFRYDQDPALDNPGELRREANFLRNPPPDLRTPVLYRFGEHAQAGWLVRERLPGTLLLERLADLGPVARHRILGDILAQLVSLEDAGLYHSDLRLWNILLGPADTAQLIDYGAIGPAASDRAWPHNPFLAFLIFVHELTTATAARPEPLRPAAISPWRLLPPYRAWLARHWQESPADWSFRRLRDSYPPAPDPSATPLTDPTQPDPAASAADLWAAAVESALDIHTQASDPALLQRLLHLTAQHTKLERWSQELSQALDDHKHQLQSAHRERDQAQADLAQLRASLPGRLAAIASRLLGVLSRLAASAPPPAAILSRLAGPLRRLPATAARLILARPWLNAPVQRLLTAVPPLRAFLQRALERATGDLDPADPADPDSHAFPPEVARVRRALQRYRADQPSTPPPTTHPQRPSLAYLSPLPPARSGIADYSAELLPELARHYAITLVNAGPPPTDPPLTDPVLRANFPVIDLATFRASAHHFSRILYHMGNAEYHAHMIPLLAEHPGVMVLHDFFLGDLHYWRQTFGGERAALVSALRDAHGWPALRHLAEHNVAETITAYPANRTQCEAALGVIVHSEHARDLARQWLDPTVAAAFIHIPHLRRLPPPPERAAARAALGLPADAFVVCSFGFLGPYKCNHLLLDAWEHSQLASQPNARLVFVGQNADSDHGRAINARLRTQNASAHASDQIRITGYADRTQYRLWLAAADVAVQLRQHSRGETSGTALDSLAHGLALIVNAHGSLAQLPADSHIRLPDPPQADALRAALERLHADPQRRAQFVERARAGIAADHAPERIAAAYRDAIEAFAHHSPNACHQRQLRALAAGAYSAPVCDPASDPLWAQADALARLAPRAGPEHWYLDITALRRAQRVTGIERVTQALLLNLLADPALAQRIVPVRAAAAGYRQAWGYLLNTLGLPTPAGAEPLILPRPGDLFLGLDWAPIDIVRHQPRLAAWHAQGLRCWFLVHDILPITNPEWFTPQMPPQFRAWLTAVTTLADGCVCVSGATADSLAGWWADQDVACPPRLCVSHHGADLPAASTAPVQLPPTLAAPLAARPTLLMVGTLEPRKGYHHAISALEHLWATGTDLNLVIVGGEGWPHDSPADRAPVSAIAARIRRHPELGKRLFWPSAVSDQTLTALYCHASALLAASENEGFGLPLIEAAHHRLALILRDIPVFREIAADHAWYFPASAGPDGQALAATIASWLRARPPETAPVPPTRTWADSAAHLAQLLQADLNNSNLRKFSVARGSANNYT